MQKYLVERKGIDSSRILEEDRAENTRENFAFSKAMIEERLGADAKIAFVTTDFHVFRAGRVAKKAGISMSTARQIADTVEQNVTQRLAAYLNR